VEVSPEEALRFACNAVVVGRDIAIPDGCAQLPAALSQRGYRCHELPMIEFYESGRRLQMSGSHPSAAVTPGSRSAMFAL
jgi:N-dimethylarginine dimethylaminohydrolase